MTRNRAIARVALAGAVTALLAVVYQQGQARNLPGLAVSALPPGLATVTVHCRANTTPGFVTPPTLTISRGDSVEWQMAHNVISDSINISLKGSGQTWPFAVKVPPHGRPPVVAPQATDTGTYRYRVVLWCPGPGNVIRPDTIDPVLIIQ